MSLTKCGYCNQYHDTVREAMDCCSDRLEDDEDGGDQGGAAVALPDGGSLDIEARIEEKREVVHEELPDADPRVARAVAMTVVGYEVATDSGVGEATVAGAIMAAADEIRADAGVDFEHAVQELRRSRG